MSQVFISYSREDGDFAQQLRRQLEEDGNDVWMDTDIPAGREWRVEIDTEIRKSSALIVIMTTDAKKSEYVTYEWGCAIGAGVEVIPVLRTGEPNELHSRLQGIQRLDFRGENPPWTELKTLLRERVASARNVPPMGGLHGYSGEWRINTSFNLWQGHRVSAPDKVAFQGSMFLLLAADGKHGAGTQSGTLSVAFTNWAAKYQVANRIVEAHLTSAGVLEVTCEVLSRALVSGQQPPPPHSSELFGDGQFRVRLRPAAANERRLTGEHGYIAGTDYQTADETYDYVGFAAT